MTSVFFTWVTWDIFFTGCFLHFRTHFTAAIETGNVFHDFKMSLLRICINVLFALKLHQWPAPALTECMPYLICQWHQYPVKMHTFESINSKLSNIDHFLLLKNFAFSLLSLTHTHARTHAHTHTHTHTHRDNPYSHLCAHYCHFIL